MTNILFYIYIIIGFVFSLYDWLKIEKPKYDEMVKNNIPVEDGMIPIYFITLILGWPIYLLFRIFK